MKRGKKEKLKQKKTIFKAKYGYCPIHKKANKIRYKRGWSQTTKHYSYTANIKRIKDDDVLFDLAKQGSLSSIAVKNHNFRDLNKLLELINGDYGNGVRMAAVRKIDDEEILLDLINNHYYWHVRKTALEKINPRNEPAFINAALNDEDYMVRRCAVKYIYHQDTLVYLSRNDEDVIVRIECLGKIRNIDIIIYVAKHDKNWRVRNAAIDLIDDIDVLKDILKLERNMFLKETIENRIRKLNHC